MDVGHLRKVPSGPAFLPYGTGDVCIKIFGDQDEDVDIDDGGSQASIGRQTLPQLTAGEDGSPKYSDGSVPKVSMEGTSKRVHANECRLRISETNGRVQKLSSVQTLSKRKALETGPSTSTPPKRAKLHGNSCDSSDIVRQEKKTEEVARSAQAGVEPVGVEVCTEFVLVEADRCLVPEEPSNMLIIQSRVPEYEPNQVITGTITSGDSSLEQGLGWVLLSPVPEIRTVQVDDSSRVAQSSASPAEEQQRQHLGRVSSSGTPAVSSQRGHAVQPVTGLDLPHSQPPAVMSTAPMQSSSVQRAKGRSQRPAAMSTAAAMQACGVQTCGQPQRSNTAVSPSTTATVPRGAPVVSRSVSAPAKAPAVPSSVGNMARPSIPVSLAALAGSVTGHVYPDVLLKGKEKLSEDLEKAKAAHESEAQRIKAEYDREAEILHKKYEALLVEEHRSFTRRQHEVRQNIVEVEGNRQLAEDLKLREELAARAAVFAGLATQFAVQPLVNQEAPQQISGRPRTTVVPVHAGIFRSTPNTVNAGSASAPIVEGIPVQLTSQVRSGAQEQVANVATPGMPQSVIYLSDSDDW